MATKEEKRNKLIGERLRQSIDGWGTTGQLAIQYRSRTGKKQSEDGIRKYIRGERTLPDHKAKAFSQILNIESGFLLADDDGKCTSYNDYVNWLRKQGRLKELSPDLIRKQTILKLVGFDLFVNQDVMVDINGKKYDYKTAIGNTTEYHDIYQPDLDELDEKVTAYIKNLVQGIIMKNEQLEVFSSGPDFDKRLNELKKKSLK